MTDFHDILTGEIISGVASANEAVRSGVAAQGILADSNISKFFEQHTKDLVKALMSVDPSNTQSIVVILVGLKALGALHNHLTQAVTSGLAAAQRLNEQATQGGST